MNIVFSFIFLLASFILIVTAKPALILESAILACEKTVALSLSLIAIYAFWLGVLELVEKTGLHKKLSKGFKPLSTKLFGKQNEYVTGQIAINLSSNMLGMGNASTPSGINAIKHLGKNKTKMTHSLAMLMIINTTAIQIVPTTIIGLRITNNSTNATSIFLPTLICTALTTLIGIGLVIIVNKIKKNKGKNK